MDLSIVIPVLNEANKISVDIDSAGQFLRDDNLSGEIIIVDDGSSDNTVQAAKSVETPKTITLKVITLNQHRGKGFALRTGIAQTTGNYVMFVDSGSCVPYKYAATALEMIKENKCEIAHGSRKLAASIIKKNQSRYRQLCSALFHWLLIQYMKIPAELTDTQCGFKIYRGDIARELFSRCKTDGFMFDIEIITRALKNGYHIKEFPVEWTCDRDSRLSPTQSLLNVLKELSTIKKKLS